MWEALLKTHRPTLMHMAGRGLPTRMKMGRDHASQPGTRVITTLAASSMKMMPHTEKAYLRECRARRAQT